MFQGRSVSRTDTEDSLSEGLFPLSGGNSRLANLPTTALPYPSYPALFRQDTTYTWRPGYGGNLLVYGLYTRGGCRVTAVSAAVSASDYTVVPLEVQVARPRGAEGPNGSPDAPNGSRKGPSDSPEGRNGSPEGRNGSPEGPNGSPKGPNRSPEGPKNRSKQND